MRMHGIGRAYGPTGGYSANSKKAGSDSYAKSAAKQTDRMAGGANKVYQVYLQTDDMLYSGGNGTGLSFYIKYAEESTEEDPVVVAKGVDEYGEEFEQTIHINRISPRSATLVEMRALEAHLNVDKNGGLSSLPLVEGLEQMGLNDRGDFLRMFEKTIGDMTLLRQKEAAAYYQYSMQTYWDWWDRQK